MKMNSNKENTDDGNTMGLQGDKWRFNNNKKNDGWDEIAKCINVDVEDAIAAIMTFHKCVSIFSIRGPIIIIYISNSFAYTRIKLLNVQYFHR